MPELNEPDNSSAGKDVAPDMVQVSKAELEEMKAAKQFRDSVSEKAKNILGDTFTADDYLEEIEVNASKKFDFEDELNKLKNNGGTRPDTQPKGNEKPPAVTPVGLSDEDKQLLKQANTSSTAALMESHYTRFNLVQSRLPEDVQSKHTKKELLSVIGGPKRALVSDLLNDPQFDGNVFVVADYLLNESKEREQRAKEGADKNAAINRAKGSANVSSQTGATGAGEVDSAKELADAIAPSTVG